MAELDVVQIPTTILAPVTAQTWLGLNLWLSSTYSVRLHSPQPSMEGEATDAEQPFADLDAHYTQFNIHFTPSNRNKIHFSIRPNLPAPNNLLITEETAITDANRKFLNWIQIVPTTGPNVMAPYPGMDAQATTTLRSVYRGGRTKLCWWDLKQFADPINYPDPTDIQPDEHGERWYTVFIDENVYPDMDWAEYVNADARTCTVRTTPEYISSDQESIYSHSIVYIKQKSISTFYSQRLNDISTDLADVAIGVEQRNETFGLNMKWTIAVNNKSRYNGRYNIWHTFGNTSQWSTFVNDATLQHIEEVDQPNFGGLNIQAHDEYLPALVPETTQAATHPWLVAPNDPRQFETLYVTMSRNRDLNGDGIIDSEELRWILPAINEMEMVVLGNRSIASLIDWRNAIEHLPYTEWNPTPNERHNGIYHYVTSDARLLWADQHMVFGGTDQVQNADGHYWQVRSIRMLRNRNVTMPAPSNNREYTQALEVHQFTPGGIGNIKAKYFNITNIRDKANAPLSYHALSDYLRNAVSREFEYAAAIHMTTVSDGNTINSNADWAVYLMTHNTNATCPAKSLNVNGELGWRVANAEEVALIDILDPEYFTKLNINSSTIVSCSHETFLVPQRAIGRGGGVLKSIPDNEFNKGNFWIIPVRDVR